MKRQLLFLFGLVISISMLADVPQGISHQAVMRDAENNLIVESPIGLLVSIIQGAHNGAAVYVETHQVITNQHGLITYVIGDGDVVYGAFSEIDWSDSPYWLETKADPTGGTDYSISGVTKFLSVPYALHSATAEVAETLKDGSHLGEINYWDGENWVPIAPGEHNQTLRLCDGVPIWGPCLYDLVLFADPLDGGTVTGEGEYEEGTDVSITAIPNQGWEFVYWSGDIEHLDDASSAEAVVTIPAENVTLTANFQLEEADPVFTCGDNITFNYKGQQVTYGTVSRGGLCWLDRNLGASRVPISSTDAQGYGDLFQWGRLDDGHQARTSSTTSGPVNQDVPGHGNFITVGSSPWDWRSPQNNALWQGEDGINNPCPEGWRVPTEAELNAERQSWGSNNSAGAYASTLKWPVGGFRNVDGKLYGVGSSGLVRSSSVSGTDSWRLTFGSGDAGMGSSGRAGGMSVRCVRD